MNLTWQIWYESLCLCAYTCTCSIICRSFLCWLLSMSSKWWIFSFRIAFSFSSSSNLLNDYATVYSNTQMTLKVKKGISHDKIIKIYMYHVPYLSLPAWPSSLSSCSCRSSDSLVMSWSLRVELSCSMPPMRRCRSSMCWSCCSLLCWTLFRYSLCSDNCCLYCCASAYNNKEKYNNFIIRHSRLT